MGPGNPAGSRLSGGVFRAKETSGDFAKQTQFFLKLNKQRHIHQLSPVDDESTRDGDLCYRFLAVNRQRQIQVPSTVKSVAEVSVPPEIVRPEICLPNSLWRDADPRCFGRLPRGNGNS